MSMNSIEDLKQGVEIGNAVDNNERVVINDSSKKKNLTTATEDRVEADLTGIPRGDEDQPGVDIRESLTKDLLEGENSPFEKYKKEKAKEMEERMAEFEQEQELDEEEDDDSDIGVDSVLLDNEENDMEQELIVTGPGNYTVDTEDISSLEDAVDDGSTLNNMGIEVDKEPVNISEAKAEPIKQKIENPDIDLDISSTDAGLEGIEIEEEESVQEQDQDDILKHLQKLATDRLKPVSQSLNISSFTVLKKPSANTKILQDQQVKVAKWVLPNQESVVLMKEYLGSELEALREFSEDAQSMTQLSRKYHSIYDHIVSPKPSTYEAWAKTTPFADIDHYFFAVYISAFKGANFLPADCEDPKCKETFLTDDINIMDMVTFDNDEAKEKFLSLYKSEAMPTSKGLYCTEIIPLSNKVAVGFKEPSVYSLFEIASLDQRFKDKHSSIIEYIPYIDSLYLIDTDNQQLIPVGYKTYADNANKTIKSKIQVYDKVLKSLTIDEFGTIKAFIRAITDRNSGIRYKYPEVTCPKCGKTIKEKPATAEELVFTRYQLGALVNTSLK